MKKSTLWRPIGKSNWISRVSRGKIVKRQSSKAAAWNNIIRERRAFELTRKELGDETAKAVRKQKRYITGLKDFDEKMFSRSPQSGELYLYDKDGNIIEKKDVTEENFYREIKAVFNKNYDKVVKNELKFSFDKNFIDEELEQEERKKRERELVKKTKKRKRRKKAKVHAVRRKK